jgi:thioester reductase-like protein
MQTPWAHIDSTVERYCAGLDQLSAGLVQKPHDGPIVPAVVLLTGSTGNIGSQLLFMLVSDERVGCVYCLNRISATGVSSIERQRKNLSRLGLDVVVVESPKVVFLEGDATRDRFGLADDMYTKVSR